MRHDYEPQDVPRGPIAAVVLVMFLATVFAGLALLAVVISL